MSKNKGFYRDISYDSKDELLVLIWLHELMDKKILKSISRSESIELSDSISKYYHQPDTSKVKKEVYLRAHKYTPEFEIVFNESSEHLHKFIKSKDNYKGLFYLKKESSNELKVLIEVKPSFDQNNMTRLFKINQKWVYEKHKIQINLVMYNDLFADSFYPRTDVYMKKTHYKCLDEYLKN